MKRNLVLLKILTQDKNYHYLIEIQRAILVYLPKVYLCILQHSCFSSHSIYHEILHLRHSVTPHFPCLNTYFCNSWNFSQCIWCWRSKILENFCRAHLQIIPEKINNPGKKSSSDMQNIDSAYVNQAPRKEKDYRNNQILYFFAIYITLSFNWRRQTEQIVICLFNYLLITMDKLLESRLCKHTESLRLATD